MRGKDISGRFSVGYEVSSIGKGITADLQNPVGQSVMWWRYNMDATRVDPTYDVGDYWSIGRAWHFPVELPVVLASIEQGFGGHAERGLYTVDQLRMVMNTADIQQYLPHIATNPDDYLMDRVEYRGSLFQPVQVMPRGHVAHDMVVVTIVAEQVKDEEVVNDSQFNGTIVGNPRAFGKDFNPEEFESHRYPPKDWKPEGTRDVDDVVPLPRWGDGGTYGH